MADFNVNHITGKQGQQGTVLAGITTVNSKGYLPVALSDSHGGLG